ncbi:MAG: hypothetical protein MJE12_06540 [Alphaproteobacteria bacterium]|nr:hypothetical protein [Alphaproteobacteria bacterium]
MIGIVAALVLSVSAIGLTAAAIIHNQLEPTLGSAMGVAFANLFSIVLAVAGLLLAIVARHKNKEMTLPKRTLVFAIVCTAVLMAMFPFSELGMLSRVR